MTFRNKAGRVLATILVRRLDKDETRFGYFYSNEHSVQAISFHLGLLWIFASRDCFGGSL